MVHRKPHKHKSMSNVAQKQWNDLEFVKEIQEEKLDIKKLPKHVVMMIGKFKKRFDAFNENPTEQGEKDLAYNDVKIYDQIVKFVDQGLPSREEFDEKERLRKEEEERKKTPPPPPAKTKSELILEKANGSKRISVSDLSAILGESPRSIVRVDNLLLEKSLFGPFYAISIR